MKAKSFLPTTIVISTLFIHVTFAALPRYEIIDLGTLGGDSSWAHAINEAGQVVGGSSIAGEGTRAFRWDSIKGMIDLGTLGGHLSEACSINDSGQIVGFARNSLGNWRATLFDVSGNGDNTDLGTLGGDESFAFSINNSGQIVGWARNISRDRHATFFDPTGNGNNIDLGTLGGHWSYAYSINDNTQIVGWAYDSPDNYLATLFDPTGNGNNIKLGTLGGDWSSAKSINESGRIVGWAQKSAGWGRATLFDQSGVGNNIDLGTLHGGQSWAYSINDNGQIVGEVEIAAGYWCAILFDPTGNGNNIDLHTLIDPTCGWFLERARSINNNGWIVGKGINPDGEEHAYLLKLVPPKIIYVDDDATGANDGSSWADAYNCLQDALAAVWSGDEIRVAQGVYTPDSNSANPNGSGDRTATFQLINGVTIKGGYAGYNEPDPNAHDIELYETILSGDLDGNDIDVNDPFDLLTEPTRGENSYHVVTGSSIDDTAVLDGFTITAGNADSQGIHDRGGGMSNYSSSPTVTNCSFTANEGSGMFNKDNSKPTVVNCTFAVNSAASGAGYGDGGGGMYNFESSPKLINCSFKGNYAWLCGGGVLNRLSSPLLVKCTFTDNFASEKGDGGGAYNNHSTLTMVECVFTNNYARDGGGMRNYFCSTTLKNCIFRRNLARLNGGGIDNYISSPTLTNCMFNSNSASWGGGIHNAGDDNHVILNNCVFTGNYTVTRIFETYGGAICNSNRSSVMLDNCTFMANTAVDFGGTIYNFESSATFNNCILWQNIAPKGAEIAIVKRTNLPIPSTVTVDYSNVQGGAESVYIVSGSMLNWGIGNIDGDPMFHDPDGADDIPGTEDDNLRLSNGSPCIDTGDPDYVTDPNDTDLDGRPRVFNGRIDMGAYEYSHPIKADLRIVPRTINLASKGNWITCYIWLNDEYDVVDIEPNSILLESEIKPDKFWLSEDNQIAIAKFSREQVQNVLSVGQIELTITGRLEDGTTFEGADIIKVTDKAGKKPAK